LEKIRSLSEVMLLGRAHQTSDISNICEWKILITPKKWVFNSGLWANISRMVCNLKFLPSQLCKAQLGLYTGLKNWGTPWKFSARWR